MLIIRPNSGYEKKEVYTLIIPINQSNHPLNRNRIQTTHITRKRGKERKKKNLKPPPNSTHKRTIQEQNTSPYVQKKEVSRDTYIINQSRICHPSIKIPSRSIQDLLGPPQEKFIIRIGQSQVPPNPSVPHSVPSIAVDSYQHSP